MGDIVIGVGELGVSSTPGHILKTFALGSCVAVVLHDRARGVIGMVHVALPDSTINREMSSQRPGYFADTGIPLLLNKMTLLGSPASGRGLVAKIAGGASIMDDKGTFNIGKRNQLAVKKILWKYGVGAVGEDVGGTFSRTVYVLVPAGTVVLSCPGRENWMI